MPKLSLFAHLTQLPQRMEHVTFSNTLLHYSQMFLVRRYTRAAVRNNEQYTHFVRLVRIVPG